MNDYSIKNSTLSELNDLQRKFWYWFRVNHNEKYKKMRRESIIMLNNIMLYAVEYSKNKFRIEDVYTAVGIESDIYYRKRVDCCSIHDCFKIMLEILNDDDFLDKQKKERNKNSALKNKKNQMNLF